MTNRRLPSFNDFSPGLFPDIRRPLLAVETNSGDRERIAKAISELRTWPVSNKRAKNVIITLQNTKLMSRETASLTSLGMEVAHARSSTDAAAIFCKNILEKMNGLVLIDAIRGLGKRGDRASKAKLLEELVRLGITGLATATTDHTTLASWLAAAGVLTKLPGDYAINDAELKRMIGISSDEASELESLELPQRLFALALRKIAVVEGANWIPTKRLITQCLRDYPQIFDHDQMRKKVLNPLEASGWLTTRGMTEGRGAKSGDLKANAKLRGIPVSYFVPSFESAVPPDLRARIETPLSKIKQMLESLSKNERGLGLELLALRMVLDLSLVPRGFRKRAKSTGGAEVDLVAEGKHLVFSRWILQCKAVAEKAKVDSEDVAREVGIAIHGKAHVVAMVSTGGFTKAAIDFAHEVTISTHLQFLFVEGPIVQAYLRNGASKLIEHVLGNAEQVMQQKSDQLSQVKNLETTTHPTADEESPLFEVRDPAPAAEIEARAAKDVTTRAHREKPLSRTK